MGIEGYFTLSVVILMMIALSIEFAGTDVILFGALCVLMLTGVVTPTEAFSGFSNPAMLTVGVLFIISAAIQNTGAMNNFVSYFLGTSKKEGMPSLMLRMTAPIAFLSAFINNTPIVVIFAPIVRKWAEKLNLAPSKFLIPLSFAAVLGGLCTLIGTSTNLVVHGLLIQNGMPGLSLFELAWIGIPCTLMGLLYLAFIGHRFLPNRKGMRSMVVENAKEYVVEMKVKRGCELIDKNVEKAGLRNLRGLFLLDIERGGKSLGPISPREVIEAEDRLIFVGIPSAVVDLQEIPGLVPAAHEMFEKDFSQMRTHLVEAVVSSGSPVLEKTVKECNFRGKYGAGVVAVHRNGERINAKVGGIRLKAGDTLLLFTDEGFIRNWKDSQDFYLISYIKDKPPVVHHKAVIVILATILMIGVAALGESRKLPLLAGEPISILHTSLAAAMFLLLARCIPAREAKRAIRWDVLIAIASAFGISRALQNSGAAELVAYGILQAAASFGPWGALVAVYLITMLVTELLTNNAAAALIFPIALSAAVQLGVESRPFFIAVAVAASAGFMTPIGYQTHLIVQGAGGYKFGDYFKIGLPLNILVAAVALAVIPVFWPF